MSINTAGEIMGRFYADFGTGSIDAALSAYAEDLEIVDPGMATSMTASAFASTWRSSSAPCPMRAR